VPVAGDLVQIGNATEAGLVGEGVVGVRDALLMLWPEKAVGALARIKGSEPNGANLSRLLRPIRYLRGRKLDRETALGAASARLISLSALQSRGFAT
jgi:hypothetical protein